MPHYTALVTLLAILFYFYTGVRVPRARSKFGLTAPAMTGPPEFERIFRFSSTHWSGCRSSCR
jgi:glutathione S-transferase